MEFGGVNTSFWAMPPNVASKLDELDTAKDNNKATLTNKDHTFKVINPQAGDKYLQLQSTTKETEGDLYCFEQKAGQWVFLGQSPQAQIDSPFTESYGYDTTNGEQGAISDNTANVVINDILAGKLTPADSRGTAPKK